MLVLKLIQVRHRSILLETTNEEVSASHRIETCCGWAIFTLFVCTYRCNRNNLRRAKKKLFMSDFSHIANWSMGIRREDENNGLQSSSKRIPNPSCILNGIVTVKHQLLMIIKWQGSESLYVYTWSDYHRPREIRKNQPALRATWDPSPFPRVGTMDLVYDRMRRLGWLGEVLPIFSVPNIWRRRIRWQASAWNKRNRYLLENVLYQARHDKVYD